MQIFVRTLDDRTLTLDVQSEDTINDIKEIVEQREGNRCFMPSIDRNVSVCLGIPVDEQRLTLGGISLDDELTLDECRVEEESTLYVLLDLEGGGKKRKKKSYNTPKKNKHKHKKVKLAVLKYYKVGKAFEHLLFDRLLRF
jgi:small subunit ribosomal protein S27Ae